METAEAALWVVVMLVALALLFDFMNGFHDAANSIATVVSTGVLKPAHAGVFAAFFNFVAIFIFHLSVAATVGKGIVAAGHCRYPCGVWCAGRGRYLEPHHLVLRHSEQLLACADRWPGGCGDGQSGCWRLDFGWHLENRGVYFYFASAGLFARFAHDGARWLGFFAAPAQPRSMAWFAELQLVVGGRLLALGHGGNDAQKTIGIIWLLLIATGYTSASEASTAHLGRSSAATPPLALGTMFGGWRIVENHGAKDHQTQTRGRLLRRNRRCADPVSWPPFWACRSRPRTPSRGRLWAWAPPQRASAVRWA